MSCFRNSSLVRLVTLVICAVAGIFASPDFVTAQGDKVTFDDHVKPIFRQRCAACHSADKKSGGLDLSNFTALMLGGSSGASVEPGDSEGSYLYMLVTHEEEPSMPPGGNKIPDGEISMIAKWIDGGALENMSSKSTVKKKSFDMAVAADATARPEVVALPPHLPKEPIVHTRQTGTVTAMAVSPWAPIAAIAAPKQILLYNTQTLDFLGVLEFPEGTVKVLKFSQNGQLLLAGGGQDAVSGKVVVWDVATGRREIEVGDELDTVLAADISADLRWIALGGPKRVVRVFSTQDSSQVYEITKHTDWVTSLAFSPDGVLLATGDRAGGLFVWEAPTGNPYLDLRGHSAQITGLSWRIDSNLLASASEDTSVRLWEMENGSQIRTFNAHGGGTTAIAFGRDGNIATNGRDQVTKVWNQNGELQKQFTALPDIGTAVAYCNESTRVIGGDWSGMVKIWNVADGAEAGELSPNPPQLAERVAVAQSALEQSQTELQPVAAAVEEATKAMEALKAQIVSVESNKSAVTTELATTQQQLDTAQKTMEQKLAELTQMQVEMDSHQRLQPQLKELSEKATVVAAANLNDAELQTTATTLATKLTTIDNRIVELQTRISQIVTEKAATEKDLQTMTQTISTKTQELATLDNQLKSMNEQMGPMQATLNERTSVFQQVQAKVSACQAALTHWQAEVSFIDQLAVANQSIETASKTVDQAVEKRAGLEEQLAALQAQIEAARNEESSAQDALNQAINQRDALQGIEQ